MKRTLSTDPNIQLRRAYDEPGPEDGRRILVDRLWPRGRSREALQLDAWLKEAAPSTELRRWFNHDPDKWDEFQRRYRAELDANPAALEHLIEAAHAGPVTLVYAARDEAHNDAVVLREVLMERLGVTASGDDSNDATPSPGKEKVP